MPSYRREGVAQNNGGSLPASPGIKKHFGVYSENENGAKSCLAQLFMLFDINTKTVLASRISEMKNSERTLFRIA